MPKSLKANDVNNIIDVVIYMIFNFLCYPASWFVVCITVTVVTVVYRTYPLSNMLLSKIAYSQFIPVMIYNIIMH